MCREGGATAMIEVVQRSWMLTKLTFRVIAGEKHLLAFPLLAGAASVLLVAALAFPTLVLGSGATGASTPTLGPVGIAALVATYFGLAFIATFFNVCVVHSTKTRFDGGEASFADSLRFAAARVPLVAGWSAVTATVGLVLRLLEQAADRSGGVGQVAVGVVTSLVGMAWSVVTLFVIPGMVYRELGPLEALKSSVTTLRRTWGESLVRHFGLGVVQFVLLALGAAVAYGLVTLLGGLGAAGAVVVVGLAVAYGLAVILVFNVANSVFGTALYAYANGRPLPGEFDEATLRDAFRPRRSLR